ncbi:MAG: indole-3-glycerol phosphate synthase TrpC [Candidatus Margulisbacteria bacterium]|nr:indole-3-glycerol phosphate synthase TrpC [Candidatus Margulisiibacteriota bacterium]
MKTVLDKIIADKKKSIEALYENNFSFLKNLQKPGLSLIAEIKKASPSRGVVRADFDPTELAKQFTHSGASALSILTEEDHFLGNPTYIKQARAVSSLPILRKDFIIDPIQVYESKFLGANAILLIKAILTKDQCQTLLNLAKDLQLDILIEVHTEAELNDVLLLKNVQAIGINNRNLQTFEIDLNLALTLAKQIPDGILSVAESGYSTPEQLHQLEKAGINAVLIGEGLATHPDLLTFWRNS